MTCAIDKVFQYSIKRKITMIKNKIIFPLVFCSLSFREMSSIDTYYYMVYTHCKNKAANL